jgi:ribonucleoside-diphosphate reductase alpha chain
MYAYAWKVGLKTTYYLRSRPATRIAQAASGTARAAAPAPVSVPTPTLTPEEEAALACSLENPESCEACQ